jgi:excisionase family DNA binding protein
LRETPDASAFLRVHSLLTSTPKGEHVEARERLLTPGEVASLFRVDPKTVTRWAAAGRISSIRTPGGHRRFRESEVRALLRGDAAAGAAASAPAPRQPVEDQAARS